MKDWQLRVIEEKKLLDIKFRELQKIVERNRRQVEVHEYDFCLLALKLYFTQKHSEVLQEIIEAFESDKDHCRE